MLLMVVLLTAVPAVAAAQAAEDSFVAEPVPGSRTAPEGGYFLLEASPGETIQQAIGLRNDSDDQLQLRLAAVDATTGHFGGASYGLPEDAATRTGSWIRPDRNSVTLGPGESAVVSFRVAIPSDARSGQHLAGLSIAAPSKSAGRSGPSDGQAGASVDIQTRHIIAVQIDVPGRAEPALVVEGVSAAARPDGLYLEIAVANTGRQLTKAQGVITVDGAFKRTFNVDTFVPGTAISYPIRWADEAEDGQHQATVELRYGDGDTATWAGSFDLTHATLDSLAERRVTAFDEDTLHDAGSSPSRTTIVGAIVGGGLLLGAGYTLARFRSPSPKPVREENS